MNIDTGYMRKISPTEPLRLDEVLVPKEVEEQVVNMTRQQRRAWARKQLKEARRAQGGQP